MHPGLSTRAGPGGRLWTGLVALGLAVAACSSGGGSPPQPLTLVVEPPSQGPHLRAVFAPDTPLEEAERAQTELSGTGYGSTSVLRAPFRSLDVAATGVDVPRTVEALRGRLAGLPGVAEVQACPCAPPPAAVPIEEGFLLHPEARQRVRKLARTCAVSPPPLTAAGCVEEFAQEQPGTVTSANEQGHFYAVIFDAAAGRTEGHRVRRLKGTVAFGGSATIFHVFPGTDLTVTGARPTIELDVAAFPQLERDAEVSPGRVHPYPLARQLYHVSSFPEPSVTRARVAGAVAVAVLEPEKLEKQYRIDVEYK